MKSRFILLLLLFSLVLLYTSCSYADVLDDVITYANDITSMSNVPTNVMNSATYVKNSATRLNNYFNSNSYFTRVNVTGIVFQFPGGQAWVDFVVMESYIEPNFNTYGYKVVGKKFRMPIASNQGIVDGR